MNELRRSLTAELSLLAVAALWGGSFVLVHDALAQISPLEFLAIRFTLATLVVGFVFRRQLLRFSWAGWKAGLAMGAALTAGFLLQTEGLRVTTASNAGFITGLFVVITPLLGALLLRSPVSWEAWVGAALAALGLYLLSGASGDWNRGDLLELGCALAFACHILLTDRMVRRHPPGGLLVVQLGTLALVAVAGSLASGGLALPRAPQVWVALAYTSVLSTAGAFFVQTWAQLHTTPARTALILTAEPVFAGLFAFAFGGERLSPAGLVGAGLIVVAMAGVELVRLRREAREAPPHSS